MINRNITVTFIKTSYISRKICKELPVKYTQRAKYLSVDANIFICSRKQTKQYTPYFHVTD